MTWCNRLVRRREAAGGLPGVGATRIRVLRTSNGYRFVDPMNSSKSEKPSGTANQALIPLFAAFAAVEMKGHLRTKTATVWRVGDHWPVKKAWEGKGE